MGSFILKEKDGDSLFQTFNVSVIININIIILIICINRPYLGWELGFENYKCSECCISYKWEEETQDQLYSHWLSQNLRTELLP